MISTKWLSDYVDLKGVDLKDLASKITSSGINIEAVNDSKIKNLIVGYVESCDKHPDSDHLNICRVNTGSDIIQIVCGASNVRAGLKVIVALPGAILPGGFEIKKGTIRGQESNGMICALFELGLEEKTEENYNKGICELKKDAEIGMDAIEYLGLDDVTYTLDLNPNRFDCNNHISFAYEVSAVLGSKVTLPETTFTEIEESINDNFSLKIYTDACFLYNAKMVKDVIIGESPLFIKKRLEAAGMRSINNVVDISNYVMLEYGQPLHFFDYDKLGKQILVRMANENEKITTLDNKERILNANDIVITDGKKPVCIAGVMGGLNTDVDDNTKTILIESAIFNPLNVRYTSINLDLRSEASLRYEKGLNYEYCELALKRACHLLERYASGKVLKDAITYDKTDKRVKKVDVTINAMNSLLGMNLTSNDVESSLNSLGFTFNKNDDIYTVIIPNRRLDVEENVADIAEEVGRIYGYDKIKSKLPIGPTKPGSYIGDVKYRKLISKRLRSLGLNEARTYTLVSDEENNLFNYNRQNSIVLNRPMSNDKKVVRQTILPSLLKAIDYNKAHGVKDVMYYEISNVYFNETEEESKIAIAMKGNLINNDWNNVTIKTDFYLIKGIIENILDYLGLKNRYICTPSKVDSMHPGMCASVILDREEIGFVGKVSPIVTKDDVYVAEISLTKLISKKVKPIKMKEISKYPIVNRDLAFTVLKDVDSSTIMEVIKKAGGRLLIDTNVFDVYDMGDKKSIAYSLTFSDPTKTLSDDEVSVVFNKIISEVEKTGAKLRD